MSLQGYFDNFCRSGAWRHHNPASCGCRGTGYFVSDLDTIHRCAEHYRKWAVTCLLCGDSFSVDHHPEADREDCVCPRCQEMLLARKELNPAAEVRARLNQGWVLVDDNWLRECWSCGLLAGDVPECCDPIPF